MGIEVLSNSTQTIAHLVREIGNIGLWLHALGISIVLWIIIQIILIIQNRVKRKTINKIREDLSRIEKKIDKLSKKI